MDIEKSYDILGISPDARLVDIKHAYRIKVKENHPDLVGTSPSLQKAADERMKEINVAYRKILEFKSKESRSTPDIKRTPEAQTTGNKEKAQPRKPYAHNAFKKKSYRSSEKQRYRPFKNGENQTIRTENGFFTQLMALIVTGLSRIDLKKMVAGKKTDAPPATNKKKTSYANQKVNFDDILKDILKEGVFPEKPVKGRQRKTRHFQNLRPQTQTKKHEREQGPVGSVKPVSRVKGVHRDR